MTITGLDFNLTVGSWKIERLPFGELISERGAVAGRLLLELPDPQGELAQGLKEDEAVDLYFGYRGGPKQMWNGRIKAVQAGRDQAKVTALSPEKALIDTKITECFHQESSRQVARRIIKLAGLKPGRLEGPEETIPHLIFSGQPAFDCLRQLNATLERVYARDMRAQVYWLGQDGQMSWGDFDEPGPAAVLASTDNLISHDPRGEEGEVTAVLFPGLVHSQKIIVRDARRGREVTKRALAVRHQLGERGYLTYVSYGQEKGYA